MLLAPSILSADFGRLAEEARAVSAAGAEWLHIDVMDGHFVPNLTIGPCVVKSLRPVTNLFFDVHLMISDPLTYAQAFAEAGADSICFHVEAVEEPMRVIEKIRALGKRAAISVKPNTPIEAVFPYLCAVDMVLIMTVEPGFGGQKFMPAMLDKVRAVKKRAAELSHSVLVEVDGGIAESTIGDAARSGVDVFVAGSAIYGAPDYAEAVRRLRAAATV